MKSLLNIQEDIRKLENNVLDITESIKSINSDIESLRNSSNGAAIDFSKIENLARQFLFEEHPLSRLNEGRHCQIYLELLLNIVRLDPDPEMMVNRMVFVQWLQMQSKIDWPLEDLYMDCFKMDKQPYCELVDEIPLEYHVYFIVDALIIANITGMANLEICGYIADLVTILGIDSEKLKALALISKIALSQSIAGMDRKQLEMVDGSVGKYSYYTGRDVAEQVKNALRTIALELPDGDIYDFKWKVDRQQKVTVGDVIAVFREGVQIEDEPALIYGGHRASLRRRSSFLRARAAAAAVPKEIKAPVSGTIFLFKDNHIYYAVLSSETDNKDSIKAWVKARRKQADT